MLGGQVTVTVTDSPGGAKDWIGLYRVGEGSQWFLAWVYVPTGASSHSWTTSIGQGLGSYEFRLYPKDGYSPLLATSPTVAVVSRIDPCVIDPFLAPTNIDWPVARAGDNYLAWDSPRTVVRVDYTWPEGGKQSATWYDARGCKVSVENTVTTPDTTPPTTPTGLAASNTTSNSVTLTWNPATDG